MESALTQLFDSSGFMPHGHCFLWTPSLLWSYVTADSVIAASYYSIPFTLWYFANKRQDLPFRRVFFLFGAFVMACGTTHLFSVLNIWQSDYWADAGIKMFTAVISAMTAITLWRLMPYALAIPSRLELTRLNQELQNEVVRRQQAEENLLALNHQLEALVDERAAELKFKNILLTTQQETSLDAVLSVDEDAKILSYNHQFVDMFHLSQEMVAAGSDEAVLKVCTEQVVNPEEFLSKINYLYAHAEEKSRDEVELKDGRVIDRYSAPITGPDVRHYGRVWYFRDITESKQIRSELQRRESSLKEAQRIAHIGNWEIDLVNKVLHWSDEIYRIFETDPVNAEPSYEAFMQFVHPDDREKARMDFIESVKVRKPYSTEFRLLMKNGRIKYVQENWETTYDQTGKPLLSIGTTLDITERKIAEQNVIRHMQLYLALSQCNKAIVHCASEEELYSQVCRAAVQFGGVKMAWVGLVDKESRMVWPAASFGDITDYLERIQISIDPDNLRGQGPACIAIRENRPYWCQDIRNDPATIPWRELIQRAGWAASASLPLHRNGITIGAFILYSSEVNAFDELARDLLVEMATDISFALDAFDRESQRKLTEESLHEAEEQFRGLVEQSIAGICIIQDKKFTYANPRIAEIMGLESAKGLIGNDPLSWIVEDDRAEVARNMQRLIKGEVQNLALEFGALRRDGARIQVGANAARAKHMGELAIIGVAQDISEKKRAEEEINRYIEQLKTALNGTIEVVETISEMRDPYTAGHERRVAQIAVALAAELGLDTNQQEGLRVASNLHDVGKIMIPAEILSKPSKLSSIEYALVQGHVQAGYDVLKNVKFPWPVAQVVLQHHERLDGSGYPQGLKGEDILFEARILAVADVVEAMSSHRPYRPGMNIEAGLGEIERNKSVKYDSKVVDACLKLFREQGYKLPT